MVLSEVALMNAGQNGVGGSQSVSPLQVCMLVRSMPWMLPDRAAIAVSRVAVLLASGGCAAIDCWNVLATVDDTICTRRASLIWAYCVTGWL